MSEPAELLCSKPDDNSAVQKQIGCINGIIQLFDRHRFLAFGRISRDLKNRLPDGQGGKHNTKADETSQKAAAARTSKVVTEKGRISSNTSRSSVSSSGNSSCFSSLGITRSVKSERVERSSFRQSSSAEVMITQDQALCSLHRPDPYMKQPQHRDVRGIKVKSGKKEDSPTLTYIDSPRPSINKPVKLRFSSLHESLGGLSNFRKLGTLADSVEQYPKESVRLSFDGRESQDVLKSNMRLKEFPRHSLDSKRGSMVGCPQIQHNGLTLDSPREAGTQSRKSSLVAKLMGLEAFPEGKQSVEDPKSSIPSVYGEKRLTQLEFQKLGKDLHAPKEIFEAVQKFKEKMDTSKKVGNSAVSQKTCSESRCPEQRPNSAANLRNINRRSSNSPTALLASSGNASLPLIVIMEPCIRKRPTNGTRKTKEKTNPRNCSGRTVPTEKNINWRETSKEAVSPGLQKNKFNASVSSQRGKGQLGQKRSSGPQYSNQKSIIDCLHPGYYHQSEISGVSILRDCGDNWTGEKTLAPPREDIQIRKPQINIEEQPSPISVLDSTMSREESPPTLKMLSNAVEGTGELNSHEFQWHQANLKSSSIRKVTSFSSEINHIELSRMLQVQHGMGVNYTNPDHRYISEILSVSGLTRDLNYISVNSAGNLFTHKLFLALEQIKASERISNGIQDISELKCKDKLQRRLLFDVVKEILVERFVWDLSKNWPRKRKNNQYQLIHGLCSEIDKLQASCFSCCSDEGDDGLRYIIEKDLNNQSTVWAERFSDISRVVLDIERLIFNDLVSEVFTRALAASHMVRGQGATTAGSYSKLMDIF
ncbi:hypothetical protein SAY86_005907 [Trapa natans]|uniref:DUF4378 domain-containing protein n=1 Tax=Trapa natans TaxID=22666 RepID=A0AAN7L3R1_TRANT|nr:hypothetical protein SAY86_005907 [Trapa natans]